MPKEKTNSDCLKKEKKKLKKIKGKKWGNVVGPEGLFSSLFSVSLVFSPEPNSEKYHFPLYFPLPIFYPPCFHPNQTYFKVIRPKGELKEKEIG